MSETTKQEEIPQQTALEHQLGECLLAVLRNTGIYNYAMVVDSALVERVQAAAKAYEDGKASVEQKQMNIMRANQPTQVFVPTDLPPPRARVTKEEEEFVTPETFKPRDPLAGRNVNFNKLGI